MRVLNLSGSPSDIGRQTGEQIADLRPFLVAFIQARLAGLSRQIGEYTGQLREVEQVWEEHTPETLEILRGISEALSLDWNDYFSYTIASYLTDHLSRPGSHDGCTTWAATGQLTRDGAPVLAKNRDTFRDHKALQCLAYVQPEAGFPYLCLTSAGSPGVYSSGINRAGLAVADTHIVSTNTGPGIARYSWMMRVLADYKTVKEAEADLHTHPHFGDGVVVAADAGGDLAVFEIAHSVQAVLRPSEEFIVSTNHFTAPETRAFWRDTSPAPLKGNSMERRRYVEAALRQARGRVDHAWSQELMAWHGSALDSICRHPREDVPTETISSILFFPRQAGLLVASGLPCQAPFEYFQVAA